MDPHLQPATRAWLWLKAQRRANVPTSSAAYELLSLVVVDQLAHGPADLDYVAAGESINRSPRTIRRLVRELVEHPAAPIVHLTGRRYALTAAFRGGLANPKKEA